MYIFVIVGYTVIDKSQSIFHGFTKGVGDIIEREVGVFFLITGKTDYGNLLSEQLLIIPEPSQCYDKAEWEEVVDNMLLDLILSAKDDQRKKTYVDLMSYVKDNYDYERFEKELEAIR
jgi:hypothetical protein